MDSVTLLLHYLFLAGLGLITKKQKNKKKSYIFDKSMKAMSHQKWNEYPSGWRKWKFNSGCSVMGTSQNKLYVLPFWIAEEQESHK